MKSQISIIAFIIFIHAFAGCQMQNEKKENNDFPVLMGPYLGQKPPGMTPELFAPGIISYGFHELRITFSPDGDEAFYVTCPNKYSHRILVHVSSNNNKWSAPQLVPFAWECNNGGPSFSPDGSRLYFASNKDNTEIIMDGSGLDIWYIERNGTSWTDPVKLPETINSNLGEFAPSIASNGNLYFGVTDKNYKTFIYCSKFQAGKYIAREKIKIDLQPDINIGSAFIAPDESYLLFQANMDSGFGRNDIYVSFRNKEGIWDAPVNLGEKINSEYNDFGPRVSFDGKYLFFTSDRNYPAEMYKGKNFSELIEMLKSPRNGYGTLYWADAKIIDELRPY